MYLPDSFNAQCWVLSPDELKTNRVCCQINILIKPFQKPCCCNTQHFEWWWQSHKKSNSKHIQIKLGKIIFCPLLLAHGGKGKYHQICLSRILTLPTQNRQCWKIFQKIFPPKIEIGQLELGDLNNKLAAQRCRIWIFKSININLKREPRVLFCWGCIARIISALHVSADVLVEKGLYGSELFPHFKRTNIIKGDKNLCCGEICPFVSLSSCLYIGFHASIFFKNLFPNIWHQTFYFEPVLLKLQTYIEFHETINDISFGKSWFSSRDKGFIG